MEWPKLGKPIWQAFQRLGRPPSMSGLAPIGAEQILAYQELYGVRFTPWELSVIELFDSIAMEVASKNTS